MPLPPLKHDLSSFEQIEILRHEIEQFEEELKKTDSHIRAVLYEVEKRRFLMTVHEVFQHGAVVPESDALPELQTARETLAGALDAMKNALSELEAASGPMPSRPPQRPARAPLSSPNTALPQPGSSPPLRKSRFDAF